MFKALTDSDIIPKTFAPVMNEELNYLMLKESIRKKDSQLGDNERDKK